MSRLRAPSAWKASRLLMLSLVALLVGCSGPAAGGDVSASLESDGASIAAAAVSEALDDADPPAGVGDGSTPFIQDPDLLPLVTPEPLLIPARFVAVERTDREAILSLGLVSGVVRVTYNSATTNEILSVDLLRLESEVDGERFFTAFADSIGDVGDFRSVRQVGVVRGIGEEARHITFTIEGDEGDAVALLRDGIVALAVYRRPAGLIRLIDMGELLARLDTAIVGASEASVS